MKKILLAAFVLLAFSTVLKADPPKKVELSFNAETHKLKVVAVHPVKNVTDHYIDLISISVDGKEVKVLKPQKQSTAGDETDEIVVPEIKKGSKVTVKARCNRFGTKSASLTV